MLETIDRQLAKSDEELDEYQLLERIDAAANPGHDASRLYYADEYRKATSPQRENWERIRDYSHRVEVLFEDVLQLKLLNRLSALPPKQRDLLLSDRASHPGESDERRLCAYSPARKRSSPGIDGEKRVEGIEKWDRIVLQVTDTVVNFERRGMKIQMFLD